MGKSRNRLPPTSATTRELYLYSGNQCAFPGCVSSLLRDDGTWNCNVAHIYGVKPGAARGDHSLSDEDLRAPSNLLLLCLEHHEVIDNEDLEDQYPVDVVERIKAEHEKGFRQAIAGLVRIVDTSGGSRVEYPQNLGALEGFGDDDDEVRQNIDAMKPWIESVAKQPPGIRDLISVILIHGSIKPSRIRGRVYVKITQVEGVVQIGDREVLRRARHLEDEGLLSIEEDEGIYFFELIDPTSRDIGWDLFAELKLFADGGRSIVRRAIDELDFTVFDTPAAS